MHVSVAHATCAGRICTFDTKTGTSCLQAQANASGSAEAMEVGRTVARIGAQANQQGRPAVHGGGCERDLSVFLAYQASDAGVRDQAALTAASKKLAAYARECGKRVVGPTAGVMYHLNHSVRRAPGLWLLRQPLTEAQLAGVPGEHIRNLLPGWRLPSRCVGSAWPAVQPQGQRRGPMFNFLTADIFFPSIKHLCSPWHDSLFWNCLS